MTNSDGVKRFQDYSFWHEQRECFRHFDIVWVLAQRELKGRYRGSWLGFAWTFVEPLLLMGIFFFIYVIIFDQSYPYYLLYLISGMLPFFFLNNSLSKATGSMLAYSSMIRQIYCPRQIFVLAGVLSELNHFCFGIVVLSPLYLYYGVMPGLKVLFVIPNTIVLTLLITGLGFFLSVFNVFVRDTQFLVSITLRMWFYMSPVFYTTERLDTVPEPFRSIYYLNPLVPILEVYRWSLTSTERFPDLYYYLITCVITLTLFVLGSFYFHRRSNAMVRML